MILNFITIAKLGQGGKAKASQKTWTIAFLIKNDFQFDPQTHTAVHTHTQKLLYLILSLSLWQRFVCLGFGYEIGQLK